MRALRCYPLIVFVALGCGQSSSPSKHIQGWVDSWANMGMYLPDEKQIAFLRANLSDVTPELAAALSHANADIRQRATYVIGEIGTDAVLLGPTLFERLKDEPERLVRIYILDALAAVRFSDEKVTALLKEQFDSLSSDNVSPHLNGDYADVDEKINVASALFVLSKENERQEYFDFVTKWLQPPSAEMNPIELAGYWERRWVAVISLDGMRDAPEAIPLLESMLGEENAKPWVSVHVPRLLGVLRKSGSAAP